MKIAKALKRKNQLAGEAAYEVEYVAQLGKVDVDKLVTELNAQIQSLQDALDEFNFTRSVDL